MYYYGNHILYTNKLLLKYVNYNQHLRHILFDDPDVYYHQIKSTNVSHLHKLVLLTSKHKILLEYLELLLQSHEGKRLINLQTSQGYTALMLACYFIDTYNDIKTVELLIKYGANISLQDYSGMTALNYAYNNINVTKLFN